MTPLDTTTVPADLVVADLHKAFGSQPVLTGLALNVPAGTFTAVLGASGSGKTTLLRVLAGFERPDRGTVTIGDLIVDDYRHHTPAEKRHIGYVSQEGSLFPHLTVEANIGFGLPRRRRRTQVSDLLDAVDLTGLARRYPHQLSGGQQQRVALARVLAVEPRFVLLDEPFASLDANLRASVRADVQTILRKAETTAILVTHDQDEALSTADLVAVIRNGTIAQVASPEDLYAHPVDADLARFVGDANLIDGVANSGVVDTSFGPLPLCRALPGLMSQPVTVLVRPEQLTVARDGSGPGVRARVLNVDFHGHDATIRLSPECPGLPSRLVARVPGNLQTMLDASVLLVVSGPVEAWPAAATIDGHQQTATSSFLPAIQGADHE